MLRSASSTYGRPKRPAVSAAQRDPLDTFGITPGGKVTPVFGKFGVKTLPQYDEALVKEPQLVNQSAEDKGWFFKIKLSHPKEIDALMDAAAYKKFTASEG